MNTTTYFTMDNTDGYEQYHLDEMNLTMNKWVDDITEETGVEPSDSEIKNMEQKVLSEMDRWISINEK